MLPSFPGQPEGYGCRHPGLGVGAVVCHQARIQQVGSGQSSARQQHLPFASECEGEPRHLNDTDCFDDYQRQEVAWPRRGVRR